MHRNILVPTDGSTFCERAIEHGVGLAKALGARLVGVTVVQPLHTGTPPGILPEHIARALLEQRDRLASENLAGLEKAARAAGVAFETVREKDDHPWEAILRTAKAKDVDLIVMASHGRRGIAAFVLGSETQKVLTHATVPVLVVR